MNALVAVLIVLGAMWGLASDRISTRWPEHDDPFVAGRRPDWRTAVVAVFGAASLGLLGYVFGATRDLPVLGLFAVPLVLLLAVDLDQRLLPDLITLPLAAYAAVIGLLGVNPLVGAEPGPSVMIGPAIMAVAVPALLYAASLPFGPGAIGLGDLKLLIGIGLALGFPREIYGLTGAAVSLSVVVLALVASGRLARRSYIPFGPFLIVGAIWGAVLPR
jgi:leader peptidase (prepilin peptidase) / N-methyltransferase